MRNGRFQKNGLAVPFHTVHLEDAIIQSTVVVTEVPTRVLHKRLEQLVYHRPWGQAVPDGVIRNVRVKYPGEWGRWADVAYSNGNKGSRG